MHTTFRWDESLIVTWPVSFPKERGVVSSLIIAFSSCSSKFYCSNQEKQRFCGRSPISSDKETRVTMVGNQSTQMKARNCATPADPQCSPCLNDTDHSSSGSLGGGSVASQELSADRLSSGVQASYKTDLFDKRQPRNDQDCDNSINSTEKSESGSESDSNSSDNYTSRSNSFLSENHSSGLVANVSQSTSLHSDSQQISPKEDYEIKTREAELDQEVSMSGPFACAESANPDESRDSEMDTEDPVNMTHPDVPQSPNADYNSKDPVNQYESPNCFSPKVDQDSVESVQAVDDDDSEDPVNVALQYEPPNCSSPKADHRSDDSEDPVNTTHPGVSQYGPPNGSSPNADQDSVDDDDSDDSDILCTGSELLTNHNKSKSPALVESNTASVGFYLGAPSFSSKPLKEDVDTLYRPSTMTTNSDENKEPTHSVKTGATRSDPVDLVGDDTQKFKVGHQTKTVMRQYLEIEVCT